MAKNNWEFLLKSRGCSVYCGMGNSAPATRAALYRTVSAISNENPDLQLHHLREIASKRGCHVVREYTDRASGTKAKHPALDQLLADARKRNFDVIMVESLTDVASSVKQCLSVLDQLNQIGIGFVSSRESIDTTDAMMGQAMAVVARGLVELERSLRIDNVKKAMRLSRLERVLIGRRPLPVDRAAIVRDRLSGMSLAAVGKKHGVSRAMVCRLVRLAAGQKNSLPARTEEPFTLAESA